MHCLLASQISAEKFLHDILGDPLCIIFCLSLSFLYDVWTIFLRMGVFGSSQNSLESLRHGHSFLASDLGGFRQYFLKNAPSLPPPFFSS